jgi:uncharacterized protein involved in type VI secretion and phage assembly
MSAPGAGFLGDEDGGGRGADGRSGGRGGAAGMRGVAVAVVTDTRDPEGLGRVRLTYPWRDADDESDWVRVATPMAGPDRGVYLPPEVDDEVLVAFEDGDLHHPYVLGALWNGRDAPPVEGGHTDVRLVRSRAGHEVVLDDTDDGGGVTVTTAAGHRVRLDDDADEVVVEDRTGGNRLRIDAGGNAVEVTATGRVSVSAPTIELNGDGNVTVEAGGVLTLKGSMVRIN